MSRAVTVAALLWLGSYRLALVGVAIFAYLRGGGPEKFAALLFLVATLASIPLIDDSAAYGAFDAKSAVIDFIVLGALWFLLVYANRWWVIPAAGIQLIATFSHLIALLHTHIDNLAYSQMASLSAWPHLILLLMATIIHSRKIQRSADISWSKLPPAAALVILRRLRMA